VWKTWQEENIVRLGGKKEGTIVLGLLPKSRVKKRKETGTGGHHLRKSGENMIETEEKEKKGRGAVIFSAGA